MKDHASQSGATIAIAFIIAIEDFVWPLANDAIIVTYQTTSQYVADRDSEHIRMVP
jgi:hypothetical protein